MSDKQSIKKIYIDKIKKFVKHNELYYLKNNPKITDKEFDELKFCTASTFAFLLAPNRTLPD